MIRNQFLLVSFLAATLAFPAYAQQKLVPASAIPDEIAYTALFYVVRTAPAPHWDRQTCLGWLEKRGFVGDEATLIIDTATAFYARQQQSELDLARINRENAGRLLSASVEAQRKAVRVRISGYVTAAVSDIERLLPSNSRANLQKVASEIKQNIKMKAQ